MSPRLRRTTRLVDPFTATAGACLLLVIAAGFLSLSVHALTTGCIRLKSRPHGTGILHCSPDLPYWVASLSLLVLGCALMFVCHRLLRLSRGDLRR